jgi:ABC-type sugar transport system substrate-binding protein
MKKQIAMGLVFGLVVVLGVFCGGGKQGGGIKPLRFLLSNAYYTAPFCAAYNPSAIATAKSLGVELTILDGNGNQQTQLEHANLAIAQGYDGFMYFPADVEGALPVIEMLNDSGIAWVGVNAYAGDEIDKVGMKYYIGADVASFGHSIAGVLKEKFPKGARIVAIEGTAGHVQTIEMNRAFANDLGNEYIFIDKQDCNFHAEVAMAKMTDMLTAYGLASNGGQIDCIISHDDGMLTGVISALEAQGIKPGEVAIFASGSNKVVYNALKTGWLSASSTQDPVEEARLAVETMYAVIKGTAKPGWTRLPTPVAYPDTVDNFNWY